MRTADKAEVARLVDEGSMTRRRWPVDGGRERTARLTAGEVTAARLASPWGERDQRREGDRRGEGGGQEVSEEEGKCREQEDRRAGKNRADGERAQRRSESSPRGGREMPGMKKVDGEEEDRWGGRGSAATDGGGLSRRERKAKPKCCMGRADLEQYGGPDLRIVGGLAQW